MLRELVREACRRFPDRVAFVGGRRRWTFAELATRVRRLARLFDVLGVGPEDSVGFLFSGKSDLVYEIRLATFEHGATLFGIAPTLAPADLVGMIQSVRPALVVYDADVAPGFPAVLAGMLPGARALAASGPGGDYEGLLSGVDDGESRHPIAADALAAVGFTSGTTGKPKGITATHRAVAQSARMFFEVLRRAGAERELEFFNPMPLIAAGGGMIVPALHAGMTMRVPDRFDSSQALRRMASERSGVTFLTPSMLIDLLDEDLESFDLSSLRLLIYGSAATPSVRVEEAVRRLGPVLLHGYGMSECLPPVSVLWPEEHGTRQKPADPSILRSAGRPFEGVRVRIEAEGGAVLPEGQVGEIAIDSPTVTPGYWNDPERTAHALRGGWWHSGDLGFLDSGGRVHVLDRQQDLITRGDHTVSPRSVEEAASEDPRVKEICVVRAAGSERITAAVSLRRRARAGPGIERFPEELLKFLARRIDPADVPDEVRVFEELPRSLQGKVLKREVRDALADEARR
jgi:fatty-acyl-CoA synthase